MIIGIGTDICIIARIEKVLKKYGQRFQNRCFTEKEQLKCHNTKNSSACYAKRFAAKEAVSKALGTGIKKGIHWKSIEIVNRQSGKPIIYLYGKAHDKLLELTPNNMEAKVHVSLSDEKDCAQALVVIEAIRIVREAK